jgi:hypothetical protein
VTCFGLLSGLGQFIYVLVYLYFICSNISYFLPTKSFNLFLWLCFLLKACVNSCAVLMTIKTTNCTPAGCGNTSRLAVYFCSGSSIGSSSPASLSLANCFAFIVFLARETLLSSTQRFQYGPPLLCISLPLPPTLFWFVYIDNIYIVCFDIIYIVRVIW